MDFSVLGRHGHHLAAAKHDRPHIGVFEIVGLKDINAGLINLRFRIRNFDSENAGGVEQPLRMLLELIDGA